MGTEDIDPKFIDIDKWSSLDAISAMADGQLSALNAVINAKAAIADAVEASMRRLIKSSGRLVYVGAGTSGRIAVQDGAELLPTFGWPWERLFFAIAGGERALMQAAENAEDDFDAGYSSMIAANLGSDDIVIGMAASGRTPFVLGAIKAAHEKSALSIGVANNPNTELLEKANIGILLDTGAEPIVGSTRMKAGTAQKIALNLYSTALMIKLGGVYKGQMVGMKATNQKLRNRAARIIMAITGTDEANARSAISDAKGDLKIAALDVLGFRNILSCEKALQDANGNLRNAIKLLKA